MDTFYAVNLALLDAVLLALAIVTAVVYRRFRSRLTGPVSYPYAGFDRRPDDAHFDLDAFAAPRPDGEEPPW